MPLTINKASTKDRILQHGTVACSLLKDIGNATNQPYLQAIASLSLVIMETVQRVRENKEACVRMTERAYELVCAIINICRDTEAELAPGMVRSIEQFTDTLEKMLTFVRSQVRGGLVRRMLRSMEDADLIKDCNDGLKHALDVFGVQSSILAAVTMAEMQRDATQRHQELITILKERHSKKKRDSTSDSSPRKGKRRSEVKTDLRGTPLLPASPKIFYGRSDELTHVINTILLSASSTSSSPARITISGPGGIGKTALALAAAHSASIATLFGENRHWVDCSGAMDAKQLVASIAIALGLESYGKKAVMRFLSALGTSAGAAGGYKVAEPEFVDTEKEKQTEKEKRQLVPVLLVLDALDAPWSPYENRCDVEDFLSLLADLPSLTLLVTVRGASRPRQIRWTRPFLPTLSVLPVDAALHTFLDISDAPPEDESIEAVLKIAAGVPVVIHHLAGLASFEGCAGLVTRWEAEGGAVVRDREERLGSTRGAGVGFGVLGGRISEEPGEMAEGEGNKEGRGREAVLNSSNSSEPSSASASRSSINSILSGTTAVTRASGMSGDSNMSGTTAASQRSMSSDSSLSGATMTSASTVRTLSVDTTMSGTTLASIASAEAPVRMSSIESMLSVTSSASRVSNASTRTISLDSTMSGNTLASVASSSAPPATRTTTVDSPLSRTTFPSSSPARTSTVDSMTSNTTIETTLSGTTAASIATTPSRTASVDSAVSGVKP